MGLLDDAIREHLDLKRRRGADPAEIERAEREALGPVRRDPIASAAGDRGGSTAEAPSRASFEDEFEPLEPTAAPATDPYADAEHAHPDAEHAYPDAGYAAPVEAGTVDDHPVGSPGSGVDSVAAGEHPRTPEEHRTPKRRSLLHRRSRKSEPEHESPPPDDLYLDHDEDDPFADHPDDDPFAERSATDTLPETHQAAPGAHREQDVYVDHPDDELFGQESEVPPPAGSGTPEPPAGSGTPEPPAAPPAGRPEGTHMEETVEYDVEQALQEEGDNVLEETPEFLQDTPDHDRLWFEQKPPRDFDL